MPRSTHAAIAKYDDTIAETAADIDALQQALAKKQALLRQQERERRQAWHLRIGKLADACGLYDWPEEALRQVFTEAVATKQKSAETDAGATAKVQRNGATALVEVGD